MQDYRKHIRDIAESQTETEQERDKLILELLQKREQELAAALAPFKRDYERDNS